MANSHGIRLPNPQLWEYSHTEEQWHWGEVEKIFIIFKRKETPNVHPPQTESGKPKMQ